MNLKWAIFAGLFFITAGVLLNLLTDFTLIGKISIHTGVLFKVFYIVMKIARGEYKAGWEFAALGAGLALFLTGLYYDGLPSAIHPAFLMVPGILLKAAFVIIFIVKLRRNRVL
jgi:hypothetical protein